MMLRLCLLRLMLYIYLRLVKILIIYLHRFMVQRFMVQLGNNDTRMKYHNMIKNAGFTVPVLIQPTAYVSPDAVLSPGCIVRAKVVISRYASLGDACIINVGGTLSFDIIFVERNLVGI